MAVIAAVAVDKATPEFDREYSYLVPAELPVQVGCRVTVPFGRGNRRRLGIVLGLSESDQTARLKKIASLVDRSPLLGEEQLGLMRWLREHTFCSWFDAVRVLIPAGLGMDLQDQFLAEPGAVLPDDAPKGAAEVLEAIRSSDGGRTPEQLAEQTGQKDLHRLLSYLMECGAVRSEINDRRRVLDERVTMVRPTPEFSPEKPLTKKQQMVLSVLEEFSAASVKELCYYSGVTRAVVENLRKAGAVELYEQVVYRDPYAGREDQPDPEPISLTASQQAAYDTILAGDPQRPALLYGVTGSGKTQVFLKLIDATLAQGRRAIVMVPEISLTPQVIERFRSRYGSRTAVLHSSLTMGQRTDEWRRIREGKADIVIGTRSAVFAPVENLGLIVIDEEQEHTYQSESSPRFRTAEVARVRCRRHGARLLLCSATPSVESYHAAREGRYTLARLTERYAGHLPAVTIVDTTRTERVGELFSEPLCAELLKNLEMGEQSILLLNRRGYHTVMKCSSCGEAVTCPNCSVAMTYHRQNGKLMCHYCGHTQEVPKTCPHCGSTLVRFSGVGTQKAEEELQRLFPQARILRMDVDTTMSRFAYEEKFGDFAAGKYDIMVGTQMVSKGLNFPRVTLVGVLGADMSLYSDDFRSFERTFSLLTQVVGRSGRFDLPGRAIIETAQPQNPVFSLASAQDYEAFYREEILFRKVNLYPPFCNLLTIQFTSVSENDAHAGAALFARLFARLAAAEYADLPIRMLGPAGDTLYRVAGRYRCHLILKCRDTSRMRQLTRRVLEEFYTQAPAGVQAIPDLD